MGGLLQTSPRNTRAIVIPDHNREPIPVGAYSWDFATSIRTSFTPVGNEADLTGSSLFCVIIALGFLMHDALRTHKLSTLAKGANSGRCVMDAFIEALQKTPIPTILVVAGIVFLLLSIAGQLAGRLTVPPERQRQAAIIGGLLLVVGVALHIAPPKLFDDRPVPPPQPPSDTKQVLPPSPVPPSPPPSPPPLPPGQEIPTKYAGVMARVTRFGTSGAFITLEITVKNSTNKDIVVCALPFHTRLSDQETGDSWEPVNTGGSISMCAQVPASGESGTWMQFKVPNPDKRVFLLKSDLFDRPVENLVLGKPP
jgi:hypothetical protein